MRSERRRLAIGAALVVLLAGATGKLAPAVWVACDRQVWVSATATVSRTGLAPYVDRRSGTDPWGRSIRVRSEGGHRVVDVEYSLGPDGVDQRGLGDDVDLLREFDPRIALYREAEPLAALAAFGLGAWLLLVLQRRPLRALGRAALPLLGAAATGALAFPALRALELLAPTALPPWPLAAQLLTALLGGAIFGLALTPRPDEPTLPPREEEPRSSGLPPPSPGA